MHIDNDLETTAADENEECGITAPSTKQRQSGGSLPVAATVLLRTPARAQSRLLLLNEGSRVAPVGCLLVGALPSRSLSGQASGP
jgi:hypothetical protein